MNLQTQPGARASTINFLIVSILFLLSGLSSLIYQVIWTRMLVFVFGSTTFATSTVLAVFMGGLALGSFLAGRFADKAKKPFLHYGLLEGVIGVWALLTPVLFSAAIPLYKMCFESLHLNLIAFGLLRFAVATVILLLPTACMGATLPLLSRFVTERLENVGDRVGSLYAVNTLGAVIGSISAGFLLLPNLGLNLTTIIAASTNLGLALLVFILSKTKQFSPANIAETSAEEKTEEAPPQDRSKSILPAFVRVTMLSFAISGALAMIYEVAWTRSLLMVIGSTTYAFTVMLATFLIGIFLGSLICARFVDRLKNPTLWFAFAEIGLCLAGFLSLILFSFLPYWNVVVAFHYGKSPEISMFFRFCSAGIVLLPVSLFLGAIFPLAVKVCARDLESIGSSVGQLYSMNTLGAIVGSFIAGFIVIPMLGSEQTLVFCSVCNFALGAVLLVLFGNVKKSIQILTALTAVALLVWTLVCPAEFWDHRVIAMAQNTRRGLMQGGVDELPSFDKWQDALVTSRKIPFYKEGKAANVAIMETGNTYSLLTNGHIDASDQLDMENQAFLAVFPLTLKPEAKDVCVVGFGSGVTAGFALRFPIERMICSEIEPVVIETSKFFHHVNFKPEEDKRYFLEPSDGRNYLLGTAKKFDVVISEPSNPWQAGVCNLFTREYFQICKNSLNKDGLFTMWSQTNEIPPKNLAEVFSALHSAFPYVFVMDSNNGDVNAIASQDKFIFSFDKIKKSVDSVGPQANLARFKMRNVEDFIARIIICPDGMDKAVAGIVPNTDDSNHLEFEVAKSYENRLFRSQNKDWMLRHHGNIWDYIDWGAMSPEQKADEFTKIGRAAFFNSPSMGILWVQQAELVHPNIESLALLAEMQISTKDNQAALKTIADGEKLFPNEGRFPGLKGIISLRKGDYTQARTLFSDAVSTKGTKDPLIRYYQALAYSAVDLGEADGVYTAPPSYDPETVVPICLELSQNSKFLSSKPGILIMLADAYKTMGKYDESEQACKNAIKAAPKGFLSWKILAEVFGAKKQWQKSAYCWDRVSVMTAPDYSDFILKTKFFINKKKDSLALRQMQMLEEMSPANPSLFAIMTRYSQKNKAAAEFYSSMMNDAKILENKPADTAKPQ